MDPLETILRPVANLLNRNIAEVTPARELCRELDGKTIAVRVRDTALVMYFEIGDEVIRLVGESDKDPDVIITGSLITLARMAGASGADAVRGESIDLTGDASTAQAFQELLDFAKPDFEEELASVIGDVAAHRLGELARGVRQWAEGAQSTMRDNVREYLQEESRSLPSRYEVERFSKRVNALRDDVERLDARISRLMDGT